MFTFPVGFFNLIAIPTPTDPFAANVVLFLKGDGTNGSTNIIDSSPSPKTISVFGTAQISTAQSKYGGSSLYFDGTNNCFIGTPADSIYTLGSSNFTLEMWIRPFTANPNGILGWNNSATFQDMQTGNPVYSDFGGNFSFWQANGLTNNLQQLTVNVWQHHALVREGNNYRWYLNGILTVSFSNSETLTGSRICIGTQAVSPPYLGFAKFYLSHLRLTKSVRYTANFNPETDTYLNIPTPAPTDPTPAPTDPYAANVVLYLRGDGTNNSTTIVDSSPSPKTISVFGNAQISTAQSKYGGSSILLDGSGDYLSIPATGDMLFSSQNFTWEAWIYPTTLSASYRITLMGNARASAGDFGMHLQVKKNATNQTMFSAWGNENGSIGSSLNLNQWNHIACTRVGTTVEIFVNGIKGTTGSCATSITSHTAFLIGTVFENSGYASDYTGYIDSLRLTAAVRYTANFNPETDTYLNV